MRRRWPLPPLLTDRPWAIRIVLAGLVPMGFGFLCGAVLGGLLFGGFILIGHETVGGSDHDLIPDPAVTQIVITAGLGALFGTLGARTQQRI